MTEVRLIDANALKEKMKKYIVSTNHDSIILTTSQKANNEAILDCISFIDNAPTVCLYCPVCKEYEYRKMVGYFDLLCCKCHNIIIPITQPLDDLSNSPK